jgi:hypothetical protein
VIVRPLAQDFDWDQYVDITVATSFMLGGF